MSESTKNDVFHIQHLEDQLGQARREINNLRQQLKSLKHIHQKECSEIKRTLDNWTCLECRNRQQHTATQEESPVMHDGASSAAQNQSDGEKMSRGEDHLQLSIRPIGIVRTNFPEKRGTPRQPGICKDTIAKLVLSSDVFTNPCHSVEGLQEFSHMWILFHFHKNESTHIRAKITPPRLNGIRTGVFATRSPHRPNPIGLSLVKIDRIMGSTVYFSGVDMIDQTPVIDIKPYIPQYDNPALLVSISEINGPSSPSDNSENDGSSLENNARDNSQRLPAQELEELTRITDDRTLQNNSVFISEPLGRVASSNSDFASSQQELLDFVARTLDGEEGGEETEERREQVLGAPSVGETTEMAAGSSNRAPGGDRNDMGYTRLNSRMGEREAPDGEEEEPSTNSTQTQWQQQPQNNRTNQTVTMTTTAASTDNNSTSSSISSPPSQQQRQGHVRVPSWIDQPPVPTLAVSFKDRALMQLSQLGPEGDEKKRIITNVLREDPRSIYLRERWSSHCYVFRISELYVSCKFNDTAHTVTVYQVFQNAQPETDD